METQKKEKTKSIRFILLLVFSVFIYFFHKAFITYTLFDLSSWGGELGDFILILPCIWITGISFLILLFFTVDTILNPLYKKINRKFIRIIIKFLLFISLLFCIPKEPIRIIKETFFPQPSKHIYAPAYYEENTELIESYRVNETHPILTGDELLNNIQNKGFENEDINSFKFSYDLDGNYIGNEKEFDFSDSYPVASFDYYYVSDNGGAFWWNVRIIDDEIFAYPISYWISGKDIKPVVYSENEWIISYDSWLFDNTFYKNIQDGIITVDEITKDKLDDITVNEYGYLLTNSDDSYKYSDIEFIKNIDSAKQTEIVKQTAPKENLIVLSINENNDKIVSLVKTAIVSNKFNIPNEAEDARNKMLDSSIVDICNGGHPYNFENLEENTFAYRLKDFYADTATLYGPKSKVIVVLPSLPKNLSNAIDANENTVFKYSIYIFNSALEKIVKQLNKEGFKNIHYADADNIYWSKYVR